LRLEEAEGSLSKDFPYPTGRFTVSGLRVEGICFECECRILEIGGEAPMTLAWCECEFPEDHHEMELL
jgi:hypothetical protein